METTVLDLIMNTLRPTPKRPHRQHFQIILLNEFRNISIEIQLEFVPRWNLEYVPLVQVIIRRRIEDRPLPGPNIYNTMWLFSCT